MTTTSTTTGELRRYMDENDSLPPECILGYIAWFSVSDAAYDGQAMELEFARLGLNPAFLPGAINPADAFEKATMTVQGHKYAMSHTTTAEILIREIPRTQHKITRKMIRETKDANQKHLGYHEVGEFVFYRPVAQPNGQVDHKTARVNTVLDANLGAEERAELAAKVSDFDQAFFRFRNFHDGQRVRGMVRGYLLHLNAIQMKPSVYFVHQTRADELHALQTFVNGLGAGTSLALLQLPDLTGLRTEVITAFEREAEKEFTDVIAEINKITSTRKGPIRMEKFVQIKKRYDEVLAKAGEYSRTLELSQDRTAGAAELAFEALTDLGIRVADGK